MKFKLLIVSLLIFSTVSAQDFFMARKLADGYFSSFDFNKALPFYEQLAKRNPKDESLWLKMATIYDHLNDSKNSERTYAALVNINDKKPEYLLNYALALSRNGKYEESKHFYLKFKEVRPDDPRGEHFAKAYGNMSVFYRDSAAFNIKKTPFSNEADDFSPAYFGKAIIFSSDRSGFSMVRSKYNWTQSAYLDLYQADPTSKEAKPFSKELNTIYHEGPMTFNKSEDTIIFTRSNYFHSHLHKSSQGVNKLSLFQANWDDQKKKWVNVTPLELNSYEYSVEHPALSQDGKDLYFASDMPGGMGGMDLYVSHRITDSNGLKTWGKPLNLGDGINTSGYEVFPFLDKEGNLWYASNGIPGLGGLDIFCATKTTSGFARPVNPGYPMNTRFDDFGYITDGAGENGYLSSNRNNSYRNDDIYSVSRSFHKLRIRVVDAKTQKELISARLGVSDQGVSPTGTDKQAANPATILLNPYKSYGFRGESQSYKATTLVMTSEQLQETDTVTIPLDRVGPLFHLTGVVYAALDKKPISWAVTKVVAENEKEGQKIKSDKNGFFQAELLPETIIRLMSPIWQPVANAVLFR